MIGKGSRPTGYSYKNKQKMTSLILLAFDKLSPRAISKKTHKGIPTSWLTGKTMKNSNLLYAEQRIQSCEKCRLHKTRTQIVFGAGNTDPQIMLVGEAPGEQEDLTGLPFVGWAGSVLDQSLRNVQIARPDLYITNILKCRPPNNRDPWASEMISCTKYLLAQIYSLKPQVIIALGKYAGNFFTGTLDDPVPVYLLRQDPGITFQHDGFKLTPVVCTYHPSYVGRQTREGNTQPLYEFQTDLKRATGY